MVKVVLSVNKKLKKYKLEGFITILYPENNLTIKEQQEYISTIDESNNYCIVTDSLYIISDTKRKDLILFDNDKNITVETYGASLENIIAEYFNLTPIGKKSLIEIDDLIKNNTNIEYLESRLKDFGDSLQKFYLMRHIEKLRL